MQSLQMREVPTPPQFILTGLAIVAKDPMFLIIITDW